MSRSDNFFLLLRFSRSKTQIHRQCQIKIGYPYRVFLGNMWFSQAFDFKPMSLKWKMLFLIQKEHMTLSRILHCFNWHQNRRNFIWRINFFIKSRTNQKRIALNNASNRITIASGHKNIFISKTSQNLSE